MGSGRDIPTHCTQRACSRPMRMRRSRRFCHSVVAASFPKSESTRSIKYGTAEPTSIESSLIEVYERLYTHGYGSLRFGGASLPEAVLPSCRDNPGGRGLAERGTPLARFQVRR